MVPALLAANALVLSALKAENKKYKQKKAEKMQLSEYEYEKSKKFKIHEDNFIDPKLPGRNWVPKHKKNKAPEFKKQEIKKEILIKGFNQWMHDKWPDPEMGYPLTFSVDDLTLECNNAYDFAILRILIAKALEVGEFDSCKGPSLDDAIAIAIYRAHGICEEALFFLFFEWEIYPHEIGLW